MRTGLGLALCGLALGAGFLINLEAGRRADENIKKLEYATIQRYATPAIRLTYNWDNFTNSTDAEAIKKELEKFPDPIQQLVNDFGGKVVIFSGKLTDVLPYLRGQKISSHNEETYDTVKGLYDPDKKQIFAHDSTYRRIGDVPTVSHEFCHMLDDALGNPSESEGFRDALRKDKINLYVSGIKGSQLWANLCAMMYYSPDSRKELKEYPVVFEHFRKIEKRFLE